MAISISPEDVRRLLKYEDLIPMIENCLGNFSEHENSGVVMPVRSTVDVNQGSGYLFTMPCFSKNEEALTVKLVSMFPKQNPSIHSIIILLNSTTGAIEALLDGGVITLMRTAAASAVALKHLTVPEKCKILCIIGAGGQALSHFNAFKHVRNFTEVRVWNRTAANTQKFAKETGAIPYDNAEEAVKNADVVVTATGATTAVLCGDWLKPGAFVCSVGAPMETARELDDAVMHQSTVVVDSYDGAQTESGDIILSKAKISAEIGEVISGKATLQPNKFFLFKSLGMAVYDAVTAKHVYTKYTTSSKPGS
ncbi:ketimine reductase mu-crystallin-like isoform X1 [Dendronephthya gigantea]|uniref:ketimine reductase mu-crystallin-like isoform X1 n=2 Tax=Dendronephthya gigantea TaxID=151771 RepID=UPI00106C04CB|nr:ketimine reductase mu-crystallin-like isoform X1 [Dendronephthya gigantea]